MVDVQVFPRLCKGLTVAIVSCNGVQVNALPAVEVYPSTLQPCRWTATLWHQQSNPTEASVGHYECYLPRQPLRVMARPLESAGEWMAVYDLAAKAEGEIMVAVRYSVCATGVGLDQ